MSGGLECVMCSMSLSEHYFEADGQTVCPGCAHESRHGPVGVSRRSRGTRALGFGLATGVVGALLWFGLGAESLWSHGRWVFAIVIGLAIGVAVRRGSGGLGGWLYQGLAMLLAYFAIVSTYVPAIAAGLGPNEGQADEIAPAPEPTVDPATGMPLPQGGENAAGGDDGMPFAAAVVTAILIAPFAPLWWASEDPFGLVLIAFALWEAWRFNRRQVNRLVGPLKVDDLLDHAVG